MTIGRLACGCPANPRTPGGVGGLKT